MFVLGFVLVLVACNPLYWFGAIFRAWLDAGGAMGCAPSGGVFVLAWFGVGFHCVLVLCFCSSRQCCPGDHNSYIYIYIYTHVALITTRIAVTVLTRIIAIPAIFIITAR